MCVYIKISSERNCNRDTRESEVGELVCVRMCVSEGKSTVEVGEKEKDNERGNSRSYHSIINSPT